MTTDRLAPHGARWGLSSPLWVLNTYNRLLADCSSHLGLPPLASLDCGDLDWVLKEGPALDKELQQSIETFPSDGGSSILATLAKLPWWLDAFKVPVRNELAFLNAPKWYRYLRQILTFGYKAECTPNEHQIAEAQASFEMCELDCKAYDEHLKDVLQGPAIADTEKYRRVLSHARKLVLSVLCRIDWQDIWPSHGPGAVFPSREHAWRSDFRTIYADLNRYYPVDRYNYSWPNGLEENTDLTGFKYLDEETRAIARLVAVPKDSRGPRIICVHPAELLWVQQGQRRLLEQAIGHSRLTRGRISFRDQTVNGRLALESSKSRAYSTLDLKDASDRLSVGLVRYLTSNSEGGTHWDYLSSSRATHVELFDRRVVPVQKFAPMGNAITFPVESLVFWALACAGIYVTYGKHCTDVYVFGDDIIPPSDYVEGAKMGLTTGGLVVNQSKSFSKGFFRESCGVDAFNGEDVTPLRLRTGGIDSLSDALSSCDLAKRARLRGFEHLSASLYSDVSKRFGTLPLSNNPEAQGLFEYVDMRWERLVSQEAKVRWNSKLQRLETPTCQVRAVVRQIECHDWCHVLDSLVSLSFKESGTCGHRPEYPVPHRVRLISGWAEVKLST